MRSEWPPDTGIPFVGETGQKLAPVPRTRSYQTPFDASTQDVQRFRFEAERRIGGSVVLRNRLYYTELAWDSDGTLVNGAYPFPDGRTYVARTLVLLDDRQRLLGNQLEVGARFTTGPVEHDLLAGLEVRSLKDRFTQDVAFLPPIDLLDPVETARPPFATVPPLRPEGRLAGVGAGALRRRPPPALAEAPGVRRRAARRSATTRTPSNATERDDTRVNPMLGLTFSPTNDLALHASWGTASAPPSTQVVGPREPEESRQAEVGAKLTLPGGKASAGLALYHLERDNIAIPDSTGTLAAGRRPALARDRAGSSPSQPWTGLGHRGQLRVHGRRAHELLRARAPSAPGLRGGRPNRQPRPLRPPAHLLALDVEALRRRPRSGPRPALPERPVRRRGQPTTRSGRTRRSTPCSPYDLRRVRFRLNLRNLTGTEYATRGFGSVSAIPGRPFEVRARAEISLGER